MTDDTCVPNMAHAHLPDAFQGAGREVIHLSTSVLFYGTILLASGITIPVEPGENLIKYDFLFHKVFSFVFIMSRRNKRNKGKCLWHRLLKLSEAYISAISLISAGLNYLRDIILRCRGLRLLY